MSTVPKKILNKARHLNNEGENQRPNFSSCKVPLSVCVSYPVSQLSRSRPQAMKAPDLHTTTSSLGSKVANKHAYMYLEGEQPGV